MPTLADEMKTPPAHCTALALAALLVAGCGQIERTTPGSTPEADTDRRPPEQPADAEPAGPRPEVAVKIDYEKAAALGVTANQLKTILSETYGERPIPIDADLTGVFVRSAAGDLVPLRDVTRITRSTPPPSVQKTDADFLAKTKDPPAPAEARPGYDAWFKKYQLDLNDPKMLDADADGDGASNRAEFLADTNPRDPASRPETARTQLAMRYTAYNVTRLPLVLESVHGGSAVIAHGDRRETVRLGDTIPGLPWRVTKVSERKTTDKEGAPTDRSQVLLEDPTTKQRVTLVKDLPAKTPATHGVLASADGKVSMKVRAGEVFQWPAAPGGSYRVLDLGRDEIVLQQVETKRMWTIPRQ